MYIRQAISGRVSCFTCLKSDIRRLYQMKAQAEVETTPDLSLTEKQLQERFKNTIIPSAEVRREKGDLHRQKYNVDLIFTKKANSRIELLKRIIPEEFHMTDKIMFHCLYNDKVYEIEQLKHNRGKLKDQQMMFDRTDIQRFSRMSSRTGFNYGENRTYSISSQFYDRVSQIKTRQLSEDKNSPYQNNVEIDIKKIKNIGITFLKRMALELLFTQNLAKLKKMRRDNLESDRTDDFDVIDALSIKALKPWQNSDVESELVDSLKEENEQMQEEEEEDPLQENMDSELELETQPSFPTESPFTIPKHTREVNQYLKGQIESEELIYITHHIVFSEFMAQFNERNTEGEQTKKHPKIKWKNFKPKGPVGKDDYGKYNLAYFNNVMFDKRYLRYIIPKYIGFLYLQKGENVCKNFVIEFLLLGKQSARMEYEHLGLRDISRRMMRESIPKT